MYLPVIAPIALVIVGGWAIVSQTTVGAWTSGVAFTIILAALSAVTFIRNFQYQDAELIWRDTVEKRPGNPRAHFNLGYTLVLRDRPADAVPEFRAALQLAPDYYAAARELGRALVQSGDLAEAERFYGDEMQSLPAFAPVAHVERGRLRAERGDKAGADEDFRAETQSERLAP
jgi:tetratricopeptide (TPR) repeat protein